VRRPRDLELVLPDSYRFHEYDVGAPCIEHAHHVARRSRQAAERAARGERTDEHVRVARVTLHANAIAEDRAPGERARGIDSDDRDLDPRARKMAMRPSTSVLLPEPGLPVTPITHARPVVGKISLSSATEPGSSFVHHSTRSRGGPNVASRDPWASGLNTATSLDPRRDDPLDRAGRHGAPTTSGSTSSFLWSGMLVRMPPMMNSSSGAAHAHEGFGSGRRVERLLWR